MKDKRIKEIADEYAYRCTVDGDFTPDAIEDYINRAIKQAIAEERNEIAGWLERAGYMDNKHSDYPVESVTDLIDDIAQQLRENDDD